MQFWTRKIYIIPDYSLISELLPVGAADTRNVCPLLPQACAGAFGSAAMQTHGHTFSVFAAPTRRSSKIFE